MGLRARLIEINGLLVVNAFEARAKNVKGCLGKAIAIEQIGHNIVEKRILNQIQLLNHQKYYNRQAIVLTMLQA